MTSTVLPFLYHTRTLQQFVAARSLIQIAGYAHTSGRGKGRKQQDNSIPFEWDHDTPYEEFGDAAAKTSTITPSEAEIFKGIFDEISQGRMPSGKKRTSPSQGAPDLLSKSTPQEQTSGMARSIVEQARVMEFRDKILRRYPPSLRNAAQIALGLYELEPNSSASSHMMELDEADQAKWEERARYERARVEERERVDALMKACRTDANLWRVMEEEVFSLPARLGIAKGKSTKGKKLQRRSGNRPAESATADVQPNVDEEKRIMDVHGPLYPHFINTGLTLFETAFARPSEYAFQILPRIKELGLPSYVLGVSTPFYARLARMHWNRFGDATAALDTIQEMNSAGLYADEEVQQLLVMIRDHLHGCTWGAQGPFVMGMMEAPPYDGTLAQRLEDMERFATQSMNEQAMEYSS